MAKYHNTDKQVTKQCLQKVCLFLKTALGVGVGIYESANPTASPLVAAVTASVLEGTEGLLEHWDVAAGLEKQYYDAISETLKQLQNKHSWRIASQELSDMVDTLELFDTDLEPLIRKADAFRDQYMTDIDVI